MKVCVYGESSADEAAVRILTEAILGRPTESIATPHLRSRGWSSVPVVMPVVIRHLHFATDAEALVVVLDSDDSPVHDPARPAPCDAGCRRCALRAIWHATVPHLRPVPGRGPLRLALGLAVPEIEAWFRCGVDSRVTEAAWVGFRTHRGSPPYTRRSLKVDVYGTDRPGLPLETRRAAEEARRLAPMIQTLEQWFPAGFGSLASDVRGW